jgi:hypothetical protein
VLIKENSLENFKNLISTGSFINRTIFSSGKIDSLILSWSSWCRILLIKFSKLSSIKRRHIFERWDNISFFSFFSRENEITSIIGESHMMFIFKFFSCIRSENFDPFVS